MLDPREISLTVKENLNEAIATNKLRFVPGPDVHLLIDTLVHGIVSGVNHALASQQAPAFEPKDVALEFMKLLVNRQEQKE